VNRLRDCGEKFSHFRVVFLSRAIFHAGAGVNGVGVHEADGFGHVVWRQASGQDQM
jgi:hypothetical protein